jgi:hypothetical protein
MNGTDRCGGAIAWSDFALTNPGVIEANRLQHRDIRKSNPRADSRKQDGHRYFCRAIDTAIIVAHHLVSIAC